MQQSDVALAKPAEVSLPIATTRTLLALSALCGLSCQLRAQAGTIEGRVTSALGGQPLADAVVVISGAEEPSSAVTVRTDVDGRYVRRLAAGRYTLLAQRVGFAPSAALAVALGPGNDATASFELNPLPVGLEEELITASRRPETPMSAPATSAILTRDQLRAAPTLVPTQAIAGQVGVDYASTGLVQGNYVTRGFNNVFSGALLTLTDHRFASVPSLGLNAPYLVPEVGDDIDRIEVVLGPGAALYGPNSGAGIVHLITRTPFDGGGSLAFTAGDRSVRQVEGRYATPLGGRFAVKVSGLYLEGRDFRATDSTTAHESLPRDYDLRRWSFDGAAEYRSADTSTTVTLGSGAAVAGDLIEMTPLGAAQVRDWRLSYYQLRVSHHGLFGQVFYNENHSDDTRLLTNGTLIIDRSQLFAGQLQQKARLSNAANLTVGVDAQRTVPRTDGTITGRNEGDDALDQAGAYVAAEARARERWTFSGAARVDYHSRLAEPVFSPRLAIVFTTHNTHALRLTYNRAFNTPTTNNLFLDLPTASFAVDSQLPGIGYTVRALGVPTTGLTFSPTCGGALCMYSPFVPGQPLPANIAGIWPILSRLLQQQGLAVGGLQPGPGDIGTRFGVLNPSARGFDPVDPSALRDIARLRPEITNTLELGYKGTALGRMFVQVDAYFERKTNYIGPLNVETPNVFVDGASLATYLEANGVRPQDAQAAAQQAAKIPFGTVEPNSSLTQSSDIILTYRNYDHLERWGSDVAVELVADARDRLRLSGTYSWTNKSLFPTATFGGFSDVALNAPRNKASLGARYTDPRGYSADVRGRYVEAFPMRSGIWVGDVAGYTVFDASVGYRFRLFGEPQITISAVNLFDKRHQEFVGAPLMGRLVTARVRVQL